MLKLFSPNNILKNGPMFVRSFSRNKKQFWSHPTTVKTYDQLKIGDVLSTTNRYGQLYGNIYHCVHDKQEVWDSDGLLRKDKTIFVDTMEQQSNKIILPRDYLVQRDENTTIVVDGAPTRFEFLILDETKFQEGKKEYYLVGALDLKVGDIMFDPINNQFRNIVHLTPKYSNSVDIDFVNVHPNTLAPIGDRISMPVYDDDRIPCYHYTVVDID